MVTVERFVHQRASLPCFRAYHALKIALHLELMPDVAPISLPERMAWFRHLPDNLEVACWVAWDETSRQMVGTAETMFWRTDDHQDVMRFTVGVLPAYRRQGIGRRLLAQVASLAQQKGRKTLTTRTYDTVPAGCLWLTRLGGKPDTATHLYRLNLADLEMARLDAWLALAPTELELASWVDALSPELSTAVARLLPYLGAEAGVPAVYAPQQVQELDEAARQSGLEQWVLYARTRESGEMVGYTAVFFRADQPEEAAQGDTIVAPAYRQQGVARWLKAAMLAKIKQERPDVRRIITMNANDNAPIIAINKALGYKPYLSQCAWRVPLGQVLTYVQGHPAYTQPESSVTIRNCSARPILASAT